jgi:predicted phage baseplate assembly protein
MDSSSLQNTPLTDCGCCEGISAETPVGMDNRPGLSAIVYRVGTHALFRETLHARLSGSSAAALRKFTTRDDDDFSIALLDAWAAVADVLTFYQERIANEGYLRTATERLSVLELARLINYELRPGVAASAYLAFTIEDAPGAAGQALAIGTTAQASTEQLPPTTIPVGTKVQSIPGPGEQAQTFETIEDVEARPEWNAIRPRLTQPQDNDEFIKKSVIFDGAASDLKKGDMLLCLTGATREERKVVLVTPDNDAKTTRVDFGTPPALPVYTRPAGLTPGQVTEFPPRTKLTSTETISIIGKTWNEPDLSAVATMQGWKVTALITSMRKQIAERNLQLPTDVYAYRQQALIFGYNAPKQPTYDSTKNPPALNLPSAWADWELDSEVSGKIYLDRAYEGITPGSYITIQKGENFKTLGVDDVKILPRTAYGISSKTTLLSLDDSWWSLIPADASGKRTLKDFRDVIVYAQSEKLTLAELPIIDPLVPDQVAATGITLSGPFLGLLSAKRVILTGERADLAGVYASESLTLKKVIIEKGFTVVTFNESLAFSYVRKTVTVNANVTAATHGESVQETLGGGDAAQAFQRFTLRQPPLTYVSSSDPSGAQSTLAVRVNDVLWQEVPDFFGHESAERIYTTKLDDAGNTTVIFGDGATGARLPTGQENVKATYRKGIGLGGLVKADQLTLLMSKPLGVKGVTNPLPANGAGDPEQLEEARRNAPLTVMTLGRIVSLRDYEDFARAFSGIDKAFATWTWFGQKRGVFLTIAGSQGAEVAESSPLYDFLFSAMKKSGDPLVPLLVKSYQPGLFRVVGSLKISADYIEVKVIGEAEQKLRDTFSFAARSLGQPVYLSEVIAVLQTVPGVVAVNVTGLYRSGSSAALNDHLAAAAPSPADQVVAAAELLTLDLQPIELGTFQ